MADDSFSDSRTARWPSTGIAAGATAENEQKAQQNRFSFALERFPALPFEVKALIPNAFFYTAAKNALLRRSVCAGLRAAGAGKRAGGDFRPSLRMMNQGFGLGAIQ